MADTHSVTEKMRLSEPTTKKLNEDRPILSAAKCKSLTVVSGDIRCMRIFAGVLWRWGVKQQCGNRKRRFSGILNATSSAS